MNTNDMHLTELLSPEQCWELASEAVVGRLAIAAPDGPDIFPVNHVVDHESVVFRTAAGTKLFGAVDEMVAFEVDGYDVANATAWSVVLKGYAQEITEEGDLIDATYLPLLPWQPGPKGHFVRIGLGTVTGRRFEVFGGVRRAPEGAGQAQPDQT
jgi:nitroimidazol reductase NimA-like FMN-containing flavoprotein (pyridoxamine 5'-phosphate oxidase superfamily)